MTSNGTDVDCWRMRSTRVLVSLVELSKNKLRLINQFNDTKVTERANKSLSWQLNVFCPVRRGRNDLLIASSKGCNSG